MTPMRPPNDSTIGGVEIAISLILRIGVVASLSIVVLGTVLSFVHHHDYFSSHDELHRLTSPPADFPRTATQIWQGVQHARGQAVIMAGLMLLLRRRCFGWLSPSWRLLMKKMGPSSSSRRSY